MSGCCCLAPARAWLLRSRSVTAPAPPRAAYTENPPEKLNALSTSRPLANVSAQGTALKRQASSQTVKAAAGAQVVASGDVSLIIPPLESDQDLEQLLDRVDGVVLVGGADLDPRRDGWMLHPTIRPLVGLGDPTNPTALACTACWSSPDVPTC